MGADDGQAPTPAPKATTTKRRAPARARAKPATRAGAATAKPKATATAAKAKPKAVAAPAKPVAAPAAEAKPVVAASPETATGPTTFSLYFVRHADAGDPTTWVGDDADRPLSKKGRRQARRLGQLLKDLDVRADVVLTSSKIRAADTAKPVGKALGTKAVTDERLTVDFGRDELSALVAGLDAEVHGAVLVGHDPDFTTLLSWLVGASVPMRKGALALVDLPDREVGPGRGALRWLLPPDAIAG
jgi:phosphohistidine phosphatase